MYSFGRLDLLPLNSCVWLTCIFAIVFVIHLCSYVYGCSYACVTLYVQFCLLMWKLLWCKAHILFLFLK